MRETSLLRTMTVEEYFRFEEGSQVRHEYVSGELYAMSGATLRHNLIVDHRRRRVERHWRAGANELWQREEIVLEGRV